MSGLRVLLARDLTGDTGTFGELVLPSSMSSLTSLELPWKNNAPLVSCIPCGEYLCVWGSSKKYGMCYEVTGVPQRARILLHRGNWAGDKTKGLKSNVEGCILLGFRRWEVLGQLGLEKSREAIALFHAEMTERPFTLVIGSSIPDQMFKVANA